MKRTLLSTLLCLFLGVNLFAQPAFAGLPIGLSKANTLKTAPQLSFASLDIAQLEREDEDLQVNRFAAPIAVDISPNSHGNWTFLPDGTQVWQLEISVDKAKGLLLFYEDFNLPNGSQLFVYSPKTGQVLGAYTNASQGRTDRFMTGVVDGDELVLEYQAPDGNYETPFHIWRIDAVYKDAGPEKDLLNFGFGSSDECHDNAACTTGNNWQLERNAVARIIVVVAEGSGYCTGSVMNNTAEDGRLLFLSAFHCMDGFTPQYDLWRFDFYYETADCELPPDEPEFRSVLGCDSLAGRRAVDFLLLDLHPETTIGMEFHYLGWDRSGIAPDTAAVMHHPRGDVKKISLANNPSVIFNSSITWNNNVTTPPNHHYRITYSKGTMELGSSGAALMDKNHRVVGQLHGDAGILDCDATVGYFGRLFMSWNGNNESFRLRDWLDPLGTDTMQLDALGQVRSVFVRTDQGEGVAGVNATFSVNGEVIGSSISENDGRLLIPVLPSSGNLVITLDKPDTYSNGVSVIDIIQMQKHVLGTDLLERYRILACDVNVSNSLTTLDMIRIRKMILTLTPDFGTNSVAAWQFIASNTSLPDPLQPWPLGERDNSFSYSLGPDFQLSDFVAMKSGDANGNANTGN